LDRSITADDVESALKRVRSDAAALGVPVWALKKLFKSAGSLDGLTADLNKYLSGELRLPAEFTTVALHPILKPGKSPASKDNWRTIGYGTSVSRVLQAIVSERLQRYVERTGCLHRAQAGFMPRVSADMLLWLTGVISEDSVLAGVPELSCFIDVKAAFPSVQHADVAHALVAVGIRGRLADVVMQYLQNACVYIAEGGYVCDLVKVRVGLVEGLGFSPMLWNIVMDSLLCKLDKIVEKWVDAGLDPAPLVDSRTLPSVAFADDIRLLARSSHVTQALLDGLGEWMDAHELAVGVAPEKSAVLRNAEQCTELSVSTELLPTVQSYKYLGVWVHWNGAGASSDAQMLFLRDRVRGSVAALRTSGIRQARAVVGIIAYLTRIRPRLTYGLATWGMVAPNVSLLQQLEEVEHQALSLIMGAVRGRRAASHAICIVMLALPTLQCELDRGMIRL
jgi:hypothetical protein